MLFEPAEYTDRMNRTLAAMKAEKIDCLLLFAPESMYWLTGFDTFGYRFFQCLVVQPNGHTTLLTRSADLRQAERTSNIDEVHIWIDSANTNPARNLRDLLSRLNLLGANFGVELDTNALTAYQYRLLEDNLDNFGELTDASSLVHDLRQTKSAAEKTFIRDAAAQADRALDAAIATIKPGVSEGDVLAEMQGSIFRDGGDYPGNPIIIGAGEDALLCRTKSGRNTIAENDQVTLEWAGVAANYHACMMRTLIVGKPKPDHQRLFDGAKEALLAVELKMVTGNTFGDLFDAHAHALDHIGLSNHRLNACGYNLGARFAPSWMDGPMMHRANPHLITPDMSLFAHMIIMDSDTGTAMCLGQTYLTTDGAPECLSRHPLEMIVL